MAKSKPCMVDAKKRITPLTKARLEQVSGGYYNIFESSVSRPDRRFMIMIWGYFCTDKYIYGSTADEAVLNALENGREGDWIKEEAWGIAL